MLYIVDLDQLYFLDILAMLNSLHSRSSIICLIVTQSNFLNFRLTSFLMKGLIFEKFPWLLLSSSLCFQHFLAWSWTTHRLNSEKMKIFALLSSQFLQPSIKLLVSQNILSTGDCSQNGDCLISSDPSSALSSKLCRWTEIVLSSLDRSLHLNFKMSDYADNSPLKSSPESSLRLISFMISFKKF